MSLQQALSAIRQAAVCVLGADQMSVKCSVKLWEDIIYVYLLLYIIAELKKYNVNNNFSLIIPVKISAPKQ